MHFNYIETAALGLVAYYAGRLITARVRLLREYFIPVPVVGGTVFALLVLLLHCGGIVLRFDTTMEEFFMSMFFVSIGFFIRLGCVKSDYGRMLKLAGLLAVCLVVQNLIAVGNARLFGYSALWGLPTGSMAMVGGFGSVSVFGRAIEGMGHDGAMLAGMGMAVLGLIGGGMLGCPLAIRLIERYGLATPATGGMEPIAGQCPGEERPVAETEPVTADRLLYALLLLVGAMGIGSLLACFCRSRGIFLPVYAGGIGMGFLLGNLVRVPEREIRLLSDVSLNIFLSISLMTLNLSLLCKVLLPLLSCMVLQMAFMALFSYYVIFPLLGRHYLTALFLGGFCGFGLGSLPTGMANVNSLVKKYGDLPAIYIMLPVVSSIADAINGSLIVCLINCLK